MVRAKQTFRLTGSGYIVRMRNMLTQWLVARMGDERGGVGGTLLAVIIVIVIIISAIIAFLIPND